jgi:hypothetical protein
MLGRDTNNPIEEGPQRIGPYCFCGVNTELSCLRSEVLVHTVHTSNRNRRPRLGQLNNESFGSEKQTGDRRGVLERRCHRPNQVTRTGH